VDHGRASKGQNLCGSLGAKSASWRYYAAEIKSNAPIYSAFSE